MKAANFLNIVLALALLLLCAKLHFMAMPPATAPAEAVPAPAEAVPAIQITEASTPVSGGTVLPPPARDSMSLGAALDARATHRDFSPSPLTDQELSDLLWAANGYNRPADKKRTAPTAINRQEIDLYVCRADGAYLWNPDSNTLSKVTDADLRPLTGRMDAGPDNFALAAPVALVYVVDFDRQGLQARRPDDAVKYATVDCGFVGQNVYLHCAAAGLHTVFLGSFKPDGIAAALGLPSSCVPFFAQTVGHPASP